MKKTLLSGIGMILLFLCLAPLSVVAQGNIDWEELWMVNQPASSSHPTYGWMAGQRQYTGIAYDRIRDNLYIANPGLCSVTGQITVGCPKIHIWDPSTGLPKLSDGRVAATQYGQVPGRGGQIPIPSDTIAGVLTGTWPNGWYTSFSQGQFPIYKIDLDDENPPRLFATNLVSPVFGICFPGPPPNCDPIYLLQGPLRVWRWDTPKSSPKLAYVTLDLNSLGVGSLGNSEMTWTRWGDALDVVGKRGVIDTPNGPEVVDSVRIFTSGGAFSGQSQTNREINVILTDTRPNRTANGQGLKLDYRLGIRMISSLEGIASHGIAATGQQSFAQVWMDNNNRVTTLNNQYQTSAPLPQDVLMTFNNALSSDPITGTGPSGAIKFFGIQDNGNKFLICADGFPSNPSVPTDPNYNTRVRIMNVTTTGQERREPGFGDTPYLGQKSLSPNSGLYNYISGVDYKLEGDPEGHGYYVTVFVLMSNNGIAAFRSRIPLLPIELGTFSGMLNGSQVDLTWNVTSEVNNYGFEIERSFNQGDAWEKVGFVKGRGTSNTPTAYTFADPVTDAHRYLNTVDYRLRQIDTDGNSTISPVVNVFMNSSPTSIELSQNYPNPFNPSTSISFYLAQSGFVTLRVFNSMGEEVRTLINEKKDAGANVVTFTADGLPSGTYVYQLNVDGKIAQKKMVLMK